ncbi:hypothetical protein SDC9_123621 [bioreactor metagenome]|uniref:Uncharacterized protein n=1 Tax=bioreactor metagenome TaxID=1076179 RepID=A0A645CIK3_9ZZZZ
MLVVLGQVFQHRQHAARVAVADQAHVAAFLKQLAAHVQRQVGRVDHALHKAQVSGHQRLGVVHDEHALHIQLHARLLVAVPQIHGRVRRDVQQLRVLGVALDAVVAPGQRRLVVVADGLVELDVLLVGDVLLGACPQRARLVHDLPLPGLHHVAGLIVLALFPLFLFHEDGQADVVGILGDQRLELPGIQKLLGILAQMQGDAGAALGALDLLDLEVARAAAHPAHAFAGG